MAKTRLTKEQREQAFMPVLKATMAELDKISGGDPDLLFAFKRCHMNWILAPIIPSGSAPKIRFKTNVPSLPMNIV